MPGSTKPRQKVWVSVCQRANQPESAMTPTILASSDGWNWPSPGSLIQRLEPKISTPTPGTKHSASSTQEPARAQGQPRRSQIGSSRASKQAPINPTPTIQPWRVRK